MSGNLTPPSPTPFPSDGPTHAAGNTPPVCPRDLGPYRLLRFIHRGGMGIVYEALHTQLRRKVALKTIRSDRTQDPHLVARFQREMAAIGQFTHPNVVRATDAGSANGCHYLVMDLVDGLNLGELVQRLGPLPIADACAVAQQTALALAHVHSHGLVHRDVKPANLMLTPEGEVKLLDLGLALLRTPEDLDDQLTAAGTALGTADYIAPEQITSPHDVDVRADLYSLGCTLFKLLTGRAPYGDAEHATTNRKLHAHAQEPPPVVTQIRPEVPPDLAALLGRLLAKDPADRFAHPDEVAQALLVFTAGSDLPRRLVEARGCLLGRTGSYQHSPSLAEVAIQPPVQARPRTRRWLLAASVVTVLVLTGVAAVPYLRRNTPPTEPTPEVSPREKPAPAPQAITWPEDYPQQLRDRPWLQPIDLLARRPDRLESRDPLGVQVTRINPKPSRDLLFQPTWCRRLCGTGQYEPTPYELQLFCGRDKTARRTLLALDHDLHRRCFELEAHLPHYLDATMHQWPRGLFFGWHQNGEESARAYFVHLDAKSAPKGMGNHGQLVVGPAVLTQRPDGPSIVPLRAYQGNPPWVQSLTAPARTHQIRIRVLPGKVRVWVNAEKPIEFVPPFDPHGPLGIWTEDGAGWFKKVTITALPPP